jgi:hypothetical protein
LLAFFTTDAVRVGAFGDVQHGHDEIRIAHCTPVASSS